ncbi:MAG: hypothetical protein ACTSP9_03130 [Promethearchaeota archaeon]
MNEKPIVCEFNQYLPKTDVFYRYMVIISEFIIKTLQKPSEIKPTKNEKGSLDLYV